MINQSVLMTLNSIVGVFGWNHSATVLNVNEAKLNRKPKLAPEIVIRNELVAASSNQEVVDQHPDEEIHKQERQKHDEELVEQTVMWNLDDLRRTRKFTVQR